MKNIFQTYHAIEASSSVKDSYKSMTELIKMEAIKIVLQKHGLHLFVCYDCPQLLVSLSFLIMECIN